MASVTRDKNGNCRIQFIDGNGHRQTIRLRDTPVKAAQSFAARVDDLNSAKITGTPWSADLSAWVRDRPDMIHEKLVRVGLVESRETTHATLGALLDRFKSTSSVKPVTLAAYSQTIGSLEKHFGRDLRLTKITAIQAAEWKKSIQDEGLATATVAKRTNVAKTIFRKAVRWGLLPVSPFTDLRSGSQSNPARSFFVTLEATESILAACPSAEWRLVVGLCRYAGLRCPSEVGCLTWADVVWDRSRLVVRSSKTEGHEGKESRILPITPELLALLQAAFDAAEPGADYVVPMARRGMSNLRTTFTKIVMRAGLVPWPRLFHNLRASCATELCDKLPNHVEARWMGHSPLIAAKHYLQTNDAHFDLAVHGHARPAPTRPAPHGVANFVAPAVAQVSQNPAQRVPAPDGAKSQKTSEVIGNKNLAQRGAANANQAQKGGMGATGLEPVA